MFQGGLTAFLALTLVLGLQAPTPPPTEDPAVRLGTITGHVETPADMEIVDPVQAVLLAPRWVDVWNGDVQKRLDSYFDRYRQAFARNPEFFNQVSNMAHRDAIVFVIGRMQRELGDQFTHLVKGVSPEGRFEFGEVPLGEYKVIVVASAEARNLIWVENIEITSPIPQFIEIRNRLQ